MGHRLRALSPLECKRLIAALPEPYALAVRIMRDTGLRVGDVCLIPRAPILPKMRVVEHKTGKARDVTLSRRTLDAAEAYARGSTSFYLIDRHRVSVWRAIRCAAARLGFDGVGCHSVRKSYARRVAKRRGLRAAQRELQHDYLSTTLLYLVDEEEEI